MPWLFLVLAGLTEVAFAFCLGKAKAAQGTATTLWYAGFGACAVLSFLLLNRSLQQLPIGTAYAVWTGIGAIGTALLGMVAFGDPITPGRVFFLTTLVASVIGLKFVSH